MRDFKRHISDLDREAIDGVTELFTEVDRSVKKFRKLTGIKCPDG